MRPPASFAPAAARRPDWRTIRSLLPYLWPVGEPGIRVRVVLALLCLAAAKGVNVTVPLYLRQAVDALSTPVGVAAAVPVGILLLYGVSRLMSDVFAELRDLFFARVGQRAIRQSSLGVFRHLHALALRFHLDRRTGGVSRAIDRGTRGIEFLLNFSLFNILPSILEIGLATAILWSLFGPSFAMVTFGTILVYVTYTFRISDWQARFRRRMNENDYQASARAVDSLLNFETVKYFGNEGHEARRYDQALASYEDAAVRNRLKTGWLNFGQGIIIAVGLTILTLMAAGRVAQGQMSVGDFVVVNAYLLQLVIPLHFLGFVYREIKQALTDMEAMFSLLEETPEIQDAPDAKPLHLTGGEVRFQQVDFGYAPDRTILHKVDIHVPPGRSVAIVGPSGAGKSTLSRLLFRFYDVTGGTISIDGQDIRTLTQDSVRQAIGIVPQDTVLFNDTIGYNIAYGQPQASQDEIEQAARLAHIHDFILGLPDGYATMVGERGLKLSGGEKQRVAIARTILKQPSILLFDEATSALDTHTEKEIQASLRDVSRDRTTLIIAHRLSTVVDVDEILVMDQGRVVERGRYPQLMAMDGRFAAMWRRQQEAQHLRDELSGYTDA